MSTATTDERELTDATEPIATSATHAGPTSPTATDEPTATPIAIHTGPRLPAQRTFLDLQEPDENLPAFTHHHDIAAFTATDSAKYSLQSVSYSAEHRRLAACNGCTLVTVPVEQEGRSVTLPDMLIDAKALHRALGDAGEAGVQCEIDSGRVLLAVPNEVTRLAAQGEGKFPAVFEIPEIRHDWVPDVVVNFSPAQLGILIAYAKRIKAAGIRFAMQMATPITDDTSGAFEVSGPVRFSFEAETDPIAAGVVGIIMPRAEDGTQLRNVPADEEEPAAAADHPIVPPGKAKRQPAPTRPIPGTTTPTPPEPEWRKNSIGAAAFSDDCHEALDACEITTLGQLQDAMRRNPGKWHVDLGLHRRKAEKIADQFNQYLNEVGEASEVSQ